MKVAISLTSLLCNGTLCLFHQMALTVAISESVFRLCSWTRKSAYFRLISYQNRFIVKQLISLILVATCSILPKIRQIMNNASVMLIMDCKDAKQRTRHMRQAKMRDSTFILALKAITRMASIPGYHTYPRSQKMVVRNKIKLLKQIGQATQSRSILAIKKGSLISEPNLKDLTQVA